MKSRCLAIMFFSLALAGFRRSIIREIGGYQGGSEMKRALLANEGLEFTDWGTVPMQRVYS